MPTYIWFLTIIARTENTFDAEINAASNSGNILFASNNAACNNNNCRKLGYFGCRELCCIQY